MKKLWCRLVGHDRMQTGSRNRICLRCGAREKLRHYGSTAGWEEVSEPEVPRPGRPSASGRAPRPSVR